ncbi:hypothetical protein D3C81_1137770 [compost metagenome]
MFIKKLDTLSVIGDNKDYSEAVIKRFMSGTPIAQNLFLKYVKDNSLQERTQNESAYYLDSKDIVFLNIGDDLTAKGKGVVFFHEYGHYLDDVGGKLSNDKTFRENIMNDFRNCMESRANAMFLRELDPKLMSKLGHIRIKLEDIMNPEYWNGNKESWIDRKKLYDQISKELKPDNLSAVSDLYSGLSIVELDNKMERIVGRWKHPEEYWLENSDNIYLEAFAHCFEAQFDSTRRANLRKYFPNAYKRFEELLEGING